MQSANEQLGTASQRAFDREREEGSEPGTVIPLRRPGARHAADSARQPATESAPTPPADDGDVLADTIRRWAKPSTLEELRERGVRRVRSISMSRIAALLEKAVNRTLIQRTIDSDQSDALSLSSNAREEFLRLTRAEVAGGTSPFASDVAGDRRLHSQATSTLDRLRRELERRRRALGDQERELSCSEADLSLDSAVGARVAELFTVHSGGDDRILETEVQKLVLGELRASRKSAREAELADHRREIGLLERRIAKLSVLLGDTEDQLRRLRNEGSLDPGVGSFYEGVQGLDTATPDFERKTSLMRTIFEANLALRV